MTNYYNDNEEFVATWLEALIQENYLPSGRVDRRSIADVSPDELDFFTQCHFFAGIGGWSLALRIAGWPQHRRVWTGSCPCQPFSVAGKKRTFEDERHLWPTWYKLIEKHRPPVIFGEQVASPLGRDWLHGVRTDLEKLGYAVGAADLCAAGTRAPHLRQRLWWVATQRLGHADGGRLPPRGSLAASYRHWLAAQPDGGDGWLAAQPDGGDGWLAHASSERRDGGQGTTGSRWGTSFEDSSGLGNADHTRLERWAVLPERSDQRTLITPGLDFWDRFELTHCWDGKTRRFEPESFPLVDGFPARVGVLRAYGNAIVPQLAALFIRSYMDVEDVN